MKPYCLFILSFLSFSACKEHEEEKDKNNLTQIVNAKALYGHEFNDVRRRRRITTVPENYTSKVIYDSNSDIRIGTGVVWGNPMAHSKSFHDRKYVEYNEKGIISETDYFYKGETFNRVTSTFYDTAQKKIRPLRFEKEAVRLETIYIYNPGYMICALIDSVNSIEITTEQADSVLNSWGINRMYPDKK